MLFARLGAVAAAAVVAGLFTAPAPAATQPMQKYTTFCIVQDDDNAAIYLSAPFQAIDQPRAYFYADQFRELVERNYRVGSLSRSQLGCNNDNPEDGGAAKFRADYDKWSNKEGRTVRILNFHPREEAPAPEAEDVVIDERGQVAALAIDTRSGERYGWAIDYKDRDAADARALQECQRLGGDCHIVLRFTGGCGAYAVQRGSDAIYGWGTNTTRQAAEARAEAEVRKRGGDFPVVRVWGCNSLKPQPAVTSSALPPLAPAAPSPPAAAPVDLQEREAAALNSRITNANAEVERRNAEAKARYEAEQARFEAARRQYEADAAAAKAARDKYEADQAVWAAKVAACKAGDVAACAP